jgi:hypothetical protein
LSRWRGSKIPLGDTPLAARQLKFFRKRPRTSIIGLLIFFLLLPGAAPSEAYSVLTHEAIIDSAWDDAIRPSLLKRFPNATPEDLKTAHAFAYGGCTLQDLGYYPFGSKFFSDLVHYVRTGDFIVALLLDSRDINEYAFALGALAHYAADNNGHRIAVNRAVPILYPKLRRKYGDQVTFDQDRLSHLKTEFGFDVLQIAKGHYAPDAYHDYIGFEVSRDLLYRAFEETYSLELKSVFSDYDLAIGSYRRGVSRVIPEMTKVAWHLKKNEIQKDIPGVTRQKFLYHLSRASYERQWDSKYSSPGFGATFLALLTKLIPKVGPFRALSFRTPTPETEKLFMTSFNETIQQYERTVREERETRHVNLVNDNFDTGTITGPGQYRLADKTYADLLDRLAEHHFDHISPGLRSVLLAYYGNLDEPFATKADKKKWAKTVQEVDELKAFTPTTAD